MTRQLLDLLAVLMAAHLSGEELHGYALMKRAALTGPSTYRCLDRLEDAHLVDACWEELPEGDERPRRCYYRLNPAGVATARTLLAERRPAVLEQLGYTPRTDSPGADLPLRLGTPQGPSGKGRKPAELPGQPTESLR